MSKADRWEKSAARENARRDAKAPLFAHAGLVPHITADEQQSKVERMQSEMAERFAAHHEQSKRTIDLMRADLATLDKAALDAFDKQMAGPWAPRGLEYHLDGLSELLAKAQGISKAEVSASYRPKPRVNIERIRVEDIDRDAAAEREADAELEAVEGKTREQSAR